MNSLIQSIKKALFDSSCVCCGGKTSDKLGYLCYDCFNVIFKSKSLNKHENTYYLWQYNKNIRKLLLEYKSQSRLALGKIISSLIEEEFFHVIYTEDIDYIIPIPINYRREQNRGFNQVEEILKNLNYSYVTGERIKNTKKMHEIFDKSGREKNIKGSFNIKTDLSEKNLLIFDDIITTGATVNEFIDELKKNGNINKIIIFSLTAGKTYINSYKRMC